MARPADSSNYTIADRSALTIQPGRRSIKTVAASGAFINHSRDSIMTTKKETIVTIRKEGQKIEQTNAAIVGRVDASEFDTASAATATLNAKLCLNMLAGNVAPAIKKAASERGALRELMPSASNPDLNAIKVCLEKSPAELRAGWQAHVDSVKRVRSVSLQALAKSVTPKKPASVPFKERYAEAWGKLYNAERELANSEELKALYMLAIDAGWENPDEAKS